MLGLDLVNRLLDRLGELNAVLLHLVVAGLAFAETAMFLDLLVPGEVGLVLGGAAGRRSGVGVVGLIAAGAAGAVAGDSCSYALGRWAGHRRLGRWPRLERRARRGLDRAERFFAARGGAAVFLGRWVGALRAVVPFVAGAGGMAYPRFLAWNVLASIAWVSTVVLVGWYAGDAAADAVDRVGGLLTVAVVAGLVVWLVVRRRSKGAAAGP